VLFNSIAFALFLPLVFVAAWLLARKPRARVALLLGASYYFYGYWDPRFLGLILFSTVLDYSIGLALEASRGPRRRRALLFASLVGNLGCLAFFKYYGFFVTELTRLFEALGVGWQPPHLDLILPVGISFYTFQTLSYTIDVYRGELAAEKSFPRFALFVAFFPQLVAGPIVRASSFLPQIPRPPRLTLAAFDAGLALIFWGLFKKIVIADYLGTALVDPFWENPAAYGGLASLLGIWGYALQIYGDFSGYSDVAIGVATLLGFNLGLNFNAPYTATSPRDFWRRWHISLSAWLRDYLYISLGGNRGPRWKMYRNLMLTMLLGGLWHGASWMFVIWGAYHGLLLVLDRLANLADPRTAPDRWFRRVVMFHLVCLGWVFFRSVDGGQAATVLSSLFEPRGEATIGPYVATALAIGFATHCLSPAWKARVRGAFESVPPLLRGGLYALWLGLLIAASSQATPFIYFQF
jgi:alginate O-acetyltransferase complex protein AlgI